MRYGESRRRAVAREARSISIRASHRVDDGRRGFQNGTREIFEGRSHVVGKGDAGGALR